MMKLNSYLYACLFVALCFSAIQAQNTDVLKRYTSCTFDDGLRIMRVQKGDNVKSRAVQTKDGEREVTRLASYEVLVAYPGKDVFASIRPELSVKERYAEDKKNVIASMQEMSKTSLDSEAPQPLTANYNGFESISNNRKAIGTYNTIGIHVLFNDKDKTITTVYLFNADPARRSFQTIEEWKALKEKFLGNYTRCIGKSSNR